MTAQEREILNYEIHACVGYHLNAVQNCREHFGMNGLIFTEEHENYIFESFVDE